MATITTYRRLFEVRLLHEYYLLSKSNLTYFDLSDQDRLTVLQERLLMNQYLLRKDLRIEPTESTKTTLAGLRWHFVPTATGFTVAASTKDVPVGNNLVTKPAIEPLPQTSLYFIVRRNSPLFLNYTALPLLKPALPAIYYFSNRPIAVHNASFRSMSVPVPPFAAGDGYEMGELANHGPDIKEYTAHTDPAKQWRTVGNGQGLGYAHAGDRIALPKRFVYPLSKSQNILQADFTLKNSSGDILKTISVQSAKPLERVVLDFSAIPNPNDPAKTMAPPDGVYQLDVNAGPVQETRALFLTDAYVGSAFAIIHINFGETDADYRILGPDNAFRTIPDPNGNPIPPLFEVRLRSRITYWRYVPIFRGEQFKPGGPYLDYVQQEGNSVTTLLPQPMSYLPIGVRPENNANPVEPKFPQPMPTPIKPKPPDQLYSEYSTRHITGVIDLV